MPLKNENGLCPEGYQVWGDGGGTSPHLTLVPLKYLPILIFNQYQFQLWGKGGPYNLRYWTALEHGSWYQKPFETIGKSGWICHILISIYELWKLNPLNQFLVVEQLNTWLCLSVLPPLLWDLTSDWFQWLSMVIRIVIMIIRWVRMVEKMVRMIISVIIMGAVVIRKDK